MSRIKAGAVALVLVWAAAACATRPSGAPVSIPLPQPPRPVAALLAQLEAPEASDRAAAAWALAGAGDVEAPVIHALVIALDESTESVREAAVWALSHVKSPGFQLSQLTEAGPKAVSVTRPNYPRAAFDKTIQGIVKLEIVINSVGSVTHAEVRESVPGLDEAALACVREWRFQPATRAGRAVPMAATAPVTFRIF